MDSKIHNVRIEGPSMGPSPNKFTKYLPGQTQKDQAFNVEVIVGGRKYFIQEEHRPRMDEIMQNLDPANKDDAKVCALDERGEFVRYICKSTYKVRIVE